MDTDAGYLPKKVAKSRKRRAVLRVASRASGLRQGSVRVVLAVPGSHRYPFEHGVLADMARRAAVLGDFLSPSEGVETYVYTARLHRLPELRLAQAERWISDWCLLPREAVLPQDTEPGNLLAQHADRFALFGSVDAAEAIREIVRSASEDGHPTLVLFFVWGLDSQGQQMAVQLDGASGANIFWQFVGDTSIGSSLLDRLDVLRSEAPHIRNVALYQGWDSIDETPEYLFYRGILKPFAKWWKGCTQAKN